MDPSTTGLSFTALITVLLVAYAGPEETMRLFAFVDLHIRYSWVKFRMMLMRRKLKQQLIKDLPEFNKLIKELNKDG